MARRGKIARLPREIREELNRRLDNGEQGRRLLEWLNGLPEVRAVLDKEFEGHAISHCNLTEWRKGGFPEWRARQETFALTREIMAEGSKFDGIAAEIGPAVEMVTMAQYAAALQRADCDRDEDEDPQKRLERLSKSVQDVVRMRRCAHARERMRLERKWLELEMRRLPGAKTPGNEGNEPKQQSDPADDRGGQ